MWVWWPHNEGLLLGLKLAHRDSLDAQLWRQGGHAHRSATNRQGYSLLCVNPSPLSTYTRHGRHHRRCRVGQSLHVSKEVSLTCLSVACIFRRDHKPHRRGGYQRTVEALLEWLDERLSEQKHRTTPIVLMDANDGIGLELRAGRYRPVETQCIAAAGSRREHTAGKRLREIMEKHHMRARSAELGGPTWFGNEGQATLIDYVWAPAALPLRCSGPLRGLAAELQLIRTN